MIVKVLLLAVVFASCLCAAGFSRDAVSSGSKVLIAYFSKTNNTASVAREIQKQVGGDLFQVETQQPYPDDYRETTNVASVEQKNNARPALARTMSPEDMAKYDVIFVGFPNWWGTLPMAMFTFLEQYDLAGKTVIPFSTHEGSGLGRSPSDLARLCPGATIAKGLAVRGGSVGQASGNISDWLRELGMIR